MAFIRKVTIVALLLSAAVLVSPAAGHEFWLEPSNYMPAPDTKITVSHNYGQHFEGDDLPFVTEWHPRYIVFDEGRERTVRGYDGDLPAVEIKFNEPGLKVFGYFGAFEPQTFDTREAFEKYARKIGYDALAEKHRALGKPDSGIVESYARNAKMLLGVGDATGQDRIMGLPFELVAERNPYELQPNSALPVRLLLHGKPAADFTITVFSRADPTNPATVTTDADGRAQVTLPASGAYLLHAIHLFEPAAGATAHWESLWASLTFAVR